MRDFFKPWRRKIGVATLVMAMLFMAGWVRSYHSDDMVYFPRAEGRKFLVSGRHGLACFNESGDPEDDRTENHLRPPISITLDFPQRLKFDDLLEKSHWRLQSSICGFATFERKYPDNRTDSILIIPYWSIVLPLTLLSGYLLLSKSRHATPQRSAEPAPAIGASNA